MESVEKQVNGDGDMRACAAQFVADLSPQHDVATVVALSGDLGAGKTTFAQGIAAALGVVEQVSSPTFVLENIYALEGQRWERLVHIDAYRLEGAEELAPLGWDALVKDARNLIVLEWPEQVAGAVPDTAITIRLKDAGAEARQVTIAYAS